MTTIVKEYSRSYTGAPEETPYYAIINPENNACMPDIRRRRAASPTSACWAAWPSTSITTWMPS